MDLLENELPLFPLDMVLLPSCHVPLHIFEERYRSMVQGCLTAESEFVLILGSDEGFCDIGCAARVTDVVNRFPDGRLNILIQGTRRVRILARRDVHPFITGTVEEAPDVPEATDTDLVARTTKLYRDTLRLTFGVFDPSPHGEIDAAALAYSLAAGLDLPIDRQQALLETRSANERLRTVANLLEDTLKSLRERTRRETGNGKAH